MIPGEEVKTDGQGEVIGLFLSEEIPRGLSFGEIENNVLNWFISTEAWTRSRYLEVGSTTYLPGKIIPTACANLKTSVAAALRSSGLFIQSPRLKRPFSSVLAR